MYKVVYNNKYGGFGLSKEGLDEYNKRASHIESIESIQAVDRDDPILIELVETNECK